MSVVQVKQQLETETAVEVRLLYLVASEDEASRLRQVLLRYGFSIGIEQRAETIEQLDTQLKRLDWDVILADMSLPSLDPWRALERLSLHASKIPFIMISKELSATLLEEAMHHGVYDVVRWSDIDRLSLIMKRALQRMSLYRSIEARQFRMFRQVQKAVSLFHYNPDPIFCFDTHGRLVDANRAALTLTNELVDGLRGNLFQELFLWYPPAAIEPVQKSILDIPWHTSAGSLYLGAETQIPVHLTKTPIMIDNVQRGFFVTAKTLMMPNDD